MTNEERIERAQNFDDMLRKFMDGEIEETEFDKFFDEFMSDPENILIFE